MNDRIIATYRFRSDSAAIRARAEALAVEQSVEMPLAAIDDAWVLEEIVGKVVEILPCGQKHFPEHSPGHFDVKIALSVPTTGFRAGQLLNMLFGNSSIQDDVVLIDAWFPADFVTAFGGPNVGMAGLRTLVGAQGRALSCSALKPQGVPASDLARLAGRLAEGGIDFIKDDHGLADQSYSPFAERVPRIAEAVQTASVKTGVATRYLPSLSGTLDDLRGQVKLAKASGLAGALIAPMIVGVDSFAALKRENPDFAFMTHPAFAGVTKIAPAFLLGTLFRLLGSDATVFPNYGGRFGYSPQECRTLAQKSLAPWAGLRVAVPVPAGGMTLERVPEILDFYGNDVMLLIGGSLLSARARIAQETARIVEAVQVRRGS